MSNNILTNLSPCKQGWGGKLHTYPSFGISVHHKSPTVCLDQLSSTTALALSGVDSCSSFSHQQCSHPGICPSYCTRVCVVIEMPTSDMSFQSWWSTRALCNLCQDYLSGSLEGREYKGSINIMIVDVRSSYE